jgi:uncharacterized protein YjcR
MKINNLEAMWLWRAGKLDTELAEQFKCAVITIQKWRERNGLLRNKAIVKSLVSHEQITKLWENGLKDSEIAKELKCSVVTIWEYRTDNGMGSNVGIFDWGGEKENRGKVGIKE